MKSPNVFGINCSKNTVVKLDEFGAGIALNLNENFEDKSLTIFERLNGWWVCVDPAEGSNTFKKGDSFQLKRWWTWL